MWNCLKSCFQKRLRLKIKLNIANHEETLRGLYFCPLTPDKLFLFFPSGILIIKNLGA